MKLAPTLEAILASLGGTPVGSTDPPTEGTVSLYQDPLNVLRVGRCSGEGVVITQPSAGFGFTESSLTGAFLFSTSQAFPSRLFFANATAGALFGQAFNAAGAVAPGAVPENVVVVPANDVREIQYPSPPTRFSIGGFMAFSSTFLTYTAVGATGILGWDEYPPFL